MIGSKISIIVILLFPSLIIGQELSEAFTGILASNIYVEREFRSSRDIDTVYMRYLTFIPIKRKEDKMLISMVMTDRKSAKPTSYVVNKPVWIDHSILPSEHLNSIVIPIRFCVNCKGLDTTLEGHNSSAEIWQVDELGYKVCDQLEVEYRLAH